MVPGDILADKYRVRKVLGAGGMGLIAIGENIHLGQTVTIRYLERDFGQNEEAAKRFLSEARAAVVLQSEYVGRVIDIGRSLSGTPYVVMEHLDGCDLSSLVEAQGPIHHAVAADYILQACVALADAHGRGMFHHDMKTANLFLTRRIGGDPLIKVLDFGLAKAAAELGHMRLRKTAEILDSPMHLAPEQLMPEATIDFRADIWGLGVITYELVTGRQPFAAGSFAELCAKIMRGSPDPLPPSIPPAFAAVIWRCLERDPDKRFADVAELARAIKPFASKSSQGLAKTVRETLARGTRRFRLPSFHPVRMADDPFYDIDTSFRDLTRFVAVMSILTVALMVLFKILKP